MKHSALLLTVVLSLLSLPAAALDLQQARAQGSVGEKPDGYIGAINPTPDVIALVGSVNHKRGEEYSRIGYNSHQPADIVAKLAAAEILKTLKRGDSYMDADGAWKTVGLQP